jgi:hypothetical protein
MTAPSPLSSAIRRTSSLIFGLGLAGSQLKSILAGVGPAAIEARNDTDSAYVNVRGADPIIADDLVTLRYLQANYGGANSVKAIEVKLIGPSTSSTAQIPLAATIIDAKIKFGLAAPGAVVTIGTSSTPDLVMGSDQNDPTDNTTTFEVSQYTSWGVAGPVVVTNSGVVPSTPGTYASALVQFIETPAV